MHSLMGDRLLKHFLKGIRRKSKIVSAKETGPKPESGVEMADGSNCLENDQPQGKEATKSIETTDEVVKQIYQTSGSDMTSGTTQSPDDLRKTK